MNILIDIRLLGRGGLSGIEEYTRQIVTHLLRIDRENRYLLFYNGLRKNPLPGEWMNRKNIEIIDWKIPNRLLDASSRFLGMPAIDRRTRADLIFSPHFNILSTARTPHIITFHDLSFLHHPYFFRARQKLWHWLQNYRNQAQKASRIIADSEFTKSDLVRTLGLEEKNITVIYPGIDPKLQPLDENDNDLRSFRERYGLAAPYILYLGTLEPRKNVTAAILAFNLVKKEAAFRNLKLVLAGRPGWLYEEILNAIAASPYRDDIIRLGAVENSEKIFLYNGAEAFVYPSFFEGFGFPPLEAQACGITVVVADRTSLTETIGASGVLVDPWRVSAFARAIGSLISKPGLKKALREKGLRNSSRFSWDKTARVLLGIFQKEYERKG